MPPTPDLRDRIVGLCRNGELTAKQLRGQIVAELRRALAFDAYVFMLTDPVTRVATSPLADIPMLPWSRLPELMRWRYLTPLNRWVELLDAGGRAASLRGVTDDPGQSLLWRTVLHELEVVDTATVPFGDRYGCWGFLDLWRTDRRFEQAEIAFLQSLTSAVPEGLRRALTNTFVAREDRSAPPGPAVVVLSPNLEVRTQTVAAAETLLRLNPPDEQMAPIPAAAYNVGAALIAIEQGVPVGPAWARVHLGGSRWVTAKADRLDDGDIAVSIEPSSPAERVDLFARVHGLSAREREVLQLLADGLDYRAIAARLVLSEHTASDHVKSVLAKSGAGTRSILLSRALGAAAR